MTVDKWKSTQRLISTMMIGTIYQMRKGSALQMNARNTARGNVNVFLKPTPKKRRIKATITHREVMAISWVVEMNKKQNALLDANKHETRPLPLYHPYVRAVESRQHQHHHRVLKNLKWARLERTNQTQMQIRAVWAPILSYFSIRSERLMCTLTIPPTSR